jgi:hypothetical protein
MSGGTFDYNQYRIRDIANDIEQEIAKSGKPKSQRELKDEGGWRDNDEWYKKYPEDLNHYKLRDEILEEFKNAYEMLRKAEIYAQRVDWYLAGDDGEDSFLERLKSDLELLKSELAIKTFEVEEDEDED